MGSLHMFETPCLKHRHSMAGKMLTSENQQEQSIDDD
jgi:hypothetical protein